MPKRDLPNAGLKKAGPILWALAGCLCLALGAAGCAPFPPPASSVATSVAGSVGGEWASSEGLPPRGGTVDKPPCYLDFDDVAIPSGLGVERHKSQIFKLNGITGGYLALKGSLERTSLVRFFMKSMQRDQWQSVGAFTMPSTALYFHRWDRTCVITITESILYTHVGIRVIPAKVPLKP